VSLTQRWLIILPEHTGNHTTDPLKEIPGSSCVAHFAALCQKLNVAHHHTTEQKQTVLENEKKARLKKNTYKKKVKILMNNETTKAWYAFQNVEIH
jgi:hypothetical protein